jgi:hypothetical protein
VTVTGYPNGNSQQQPAEPPRPGRKWTAGVAALVVVFAALASYDLIFGGAASANRPSASRTAAERAPRASAASAGSASPAPSASAIAGPAPTAAVRLLSVANATAYGPDGVTDGDHPRTRDHQRRQRPTVAEQLVRDA